MMRLLLITNITTISYIIDKMDLSGSIISKMSTYNYPTYTPLRKQQRDPSKWPVNRLKSIPIDDAQLTSKIISNSI